MACGRRFRSTWNRRSNRPKNPKQKHHKLPHSLVLKAMVLNALGFVGRRLYMLPSFFEKLPVDRLLGEDVVPSDLNDDVLGRTLDAIYKYDATDLFNEIVLKVMDQLDFETKKKPNL